MPTKNPLTIFPATNFGPIHPSAKGMLHGGDYNPEQWLDTPEIIDKDFYLMKRCGVNQLSMAIFSWSKLEPQEGVYDFAWLDAMLERVSKENKYLFLATPSGARPRWLSAAYPEVLRVDKNRQRALYGERHNHCYTSPVYREKVTQINTLLAKRYHDHPQLVMWHVSNEYGGECHCDLCQGAFRDWIRTKYNDDLDQLNKAWWTTFWSHTYTDWNQVESPSPHGELHLHGLNIDWRRFVSHQTTDFMKHEIEALRLYSPDIPVTTNFMAFFPDVDYPKMAQHLDVVSWDSYPQWNRPGADVYEPSFQGFFHDLCRTLKRGRPFLLMESTPSISNWHQVCKLKRPGMHLQSCLLAIAHGSDSAQYFQWRQSRGSCEKFHGAVVSHVGDENTRIFKDVASVGDALAKLDNVVGTSVTPEVALIYDWENSWAINDIVGFRSDMKYLGECHSHYTPFWKSGTPVDVVDMESDFSRYKVLVAPMLYMLRADAASKIESFVKQGGTLVTTFLSGMVDEFDLCFQGGFPGPLRKIVGVWDEELDCIFDDEHNLVEMNEQNSLGISGTFKARELCTLIHAEGAEILAQYGKDFYAGRPAVTRNSYGKGEAYYIASRNDAQFYESFYAAVLKRAGVDSVTTTALADGLTVQVRGDANRQFAFVMNFVNEPRSVDLGRVSGTDILSNALASGTVKLAPYQTMVIEM